MTTISAPAFPRFTSRASMPAAVLTGNARLELHEVPIPQPQHGEVRVQVEGCGVCASSLPIWEGRPWFHYPTSPGEPGHEGWGYIDAIGPGVTQFRAGDRVAYLSERSFAAFDVIRAQDAVRLPPSVDHLPFPGEALACGINAFGRTRIQKGETVAVVGAGFLGILFTILASKAGAKVIAISRRAYAREMATRSGAAATLPLGAPQDIATSIRHLNEGELCHCVIEACGLQHSLDIASVITRPGGRLIVAGYHQDGLRSVDMQLWNWNGIDVINAHERDPNRYLAGIQNAVEAVSSGALNPSTLYTHLLKLEHLDQAFQLLSERPPGFLKALIVMKST